MTLKGFSGDNSKLVCVIRMTTPTSWLCSDRSACCDVCCVPIMVPITMQNKLVTVPVRQDLNQVAWRTLRIHSIDTVGIRRNDVYRGCLCEVLGQSNLSTCCGDCVIVHIIHDWLVEESIVCLSLLCSSSDLFAIHRVHIHCMTLSRDVMTGIM